MAHIMGKPMSIKQPRKGMLAYPGIFGKKNVKRDVKGRKMTQKGAIHQKNSAKQPNRTTETNHERHVMRQIGRSALYKAVVRKEND